MTDAARAAAREIMQTLGLPVFRDSVESREAWLIKTLDAFPANQTAALRAALKRLHGAGDLVAQELCEDEPGTAAIVAEFNAALDEAEAILADAGPKGEER